MFKDRASLGRMPDGFLNLWFLYQNINGNSIILVFKKGKDPLTPCFVKKLIVCFSYSKEASAFLALKFWQSLSLYKLASALKTIKQNQS